MREKVANQLELMKGENWDEEWCYRFDKMKIVAHKQIISWINQVFFLSAYIYVCVGKFETNETNKLFHEKNPRRF